MRQFVALRNSFDINNSVFVVMSPCSSLTIYMYLAGIRKIILDAGWPQVDSTRIRNKNPLSWFKSWAIDFLAFACCDYVLCESQEQLKRIQKHFLVNPERLNVSYTGFNELQVDLLSSHEENPFFSTKKPYFFFRGKLNKESGIENIIEAARNIGGKAMVVVASSNMIKEDLHESNVLLIEDFLNWNQLKYLYENAFAVLGQCSGLSRLSFSLPHKVFEAAYFKKAYISFESDLIQKVWRNSVLTFGPKSARSLSEIMLYALENRVYVEEIAEDFAAIYHSSFNQNKISKKFLSYIVTVGGNDASLNFFGFVLRVLVKTSWLMFNFYDRLIQITNFITHSFRIKKS